MNSSEYQLDKCATWYHPKTNLTVENVFAGSMIINEFIPFSFWRQQNAMLVRTGFREITANWRRPPASFFVASTLVSLTCNVPLRARVFRSRKRMLPCWIVLRMHLLRSMRVRRDWSTGRWPRGEA